MTQHQSHLGKREVPRSRRSLAAISGPRACLVFALAVFALFPVRGFTAAALLGPFPEAILSAQFGGHWWSDDESADHRPASKANGEVFWTPTDNERPYQHDLVHDHWHTHVLDDGLVIHHSHPHRHTYLLKAGEEKPADRALRVERYLEQAKPWEEYAADPGGTQFIRGRPR